MQSLSHFTHLLEKIIESVKQGLTLSIVGCRSLRQYFVERTRDPTDKLLHFRFRPNPNDHLWWLIQQLQGDDAVEALGLPTIPDEIERLVASDSKQSQRLSSTSGQNTLRSCHH